MSVKASQSDKWNFTVAQLQLRHPNTGSLLAGQFGNFRDDTGECLGTTSDQYAILQNGELMDAAHAALAERGMTDYTERVLSTGKAGQRFFAEITFANKQLAMKVGDVFGYSLIIQNSFDRSIRAAVKLAFKRLTCLNGASTLEKELEVTRKHSGNVSVDFMGEAIDKALARGASALSVFDDMADVAISDEQGISILGNFVELDVLSGSLRESVQALWLAPRRAEDKARNLWNLYNAVTEHLTHEVSRDRYEYANKVSGAVLVKLAQASRDNAKLLKLTVPLLESGTTVTVDPAQLGADVVIANAV